MRGLKCRIRQFLGTVIRHDTLIPHPSLAFRIGVVGATFRRLAKALPSRGDALLSTALLALVAAVGPPEVTRAADAERRPAPSTRTLSNLHPPE
jgi:hypothetical protein